MKIQCNVCEAAEARVLCCADEAALCLVCDEKVHAANKLASKHQRVPLSGSNTQMPKCDICQESTGYFFCLEDRALLCRKCDIAIHTANSLVSVHQRFLLTGVKMELQSSDNLVPSIQEKKRSSTDKTTESSFITMNKKVHLTETSTANEKVFWGQGGNTSSLPASKLSFSGGTMPGNISDWPFDDFFGFAGFSHKYGYTENGSSKADSGKFGEFDWSPTYRTIDEELGNDECLDQTPEVELSWKVPEISSPPTASGLYWPRNRRQEAPAFVPDIFSCSSLQNSTSSKRQRQS